MDATEIQKELFRQIKTKITDPGVLAGEIAKLLEISADSVYRRMRGEKPVTLDELHKLCTHYHISLDQLMEIQTGAFLFQGQALDSRSFRFDAYLTGAMQSMAYMNSFKQKEFYYLCKDSPFFHHFYFKEFAAFKYYFWMSTLLFFPEFKNKKVSFEEYPDELFQIGKKILGLYNQLDSIEIWNAESLNTTLRQIDYYRDGRMFKSDKDILKLYEAAEKMMDHLEKQAELGYKFEYGDPDRKPLGKFHMYFNEVVLGDNQMLAVLDGSKMAFIPHSGANYIMTRDIGFCENFYQYLRNLMRRSTLISEVSEKERAKFFKIHRERLAHRKESLEI
jgi:transcriptional regulator with XRE-family HTH domain